MRAKTKGTITSIFGIIFLLIAVAMFITNYFIEGYSFSWSEMITMTALGYVFLVAKDDLIQWLLLKKRDNDRHKE